MNVWWQRGFSEGKIALRRSDEDNKFSLVSLNFGDSNSVDLGLEPESLFLPLLDKLLLWFWALGDVGISDPGIYSYALLIAKTSREDSFCWLSYLVCDCKSCLPFEGLEKRKVKSQRELQAQTFTLLIAISEVCWVPGDYKSEVVLCPNWPKVLKLMEKLSGWIWGTLFFKNFLFYIGVQATNNIVVDSKGT